MSDFQIFKGKRGIGAFRWLSVRGQLKLEKMGMKSSGGAIRPRIAAELGLKPRDSYEKYFEAIAAKLKELENGIHDSD